MLIRRRKVKQREAEQVLRPVAMQESELDNIPLQSNFATTLHLSGDLQAAVDTLATVVQQVARKQWDELPERPAWIPRADRLAPGHFTSSTATAMRLT